MRTPDYPSDDQVKWAAVDDYFSQLLAPPDNHLSAALQANSQAGLPAHDVSAVQGKMLALLISIQNASRVLEIGTLGGYSTIWMAQALGEGGTITTIEADPRHADVARENIHQAGLSERVTLHVGAALDVLPHLQAPFDLIFIDADKKNNPGYLRWAIRLSRPGSLIIVDNIVRGGAVIDAGSTDGNVQGVRECLRLLASDPRLEATAIQTVGEKGWDGFALARVKSRKE
ncbi:O-methyltransferase [Pantoea stewartii]|uniref:O-methyltransferase n=1 Tax=Pantoea stewartii TaxID=66269 RepID=UPI0016253639|nr:O-methyltransferase [Pantoea stewartii]MBC0852544.1 O-methyltransferase [Pantoea stewartii]